jgi:hypothetical protein
MAYSKTTWVNGTTRVNATNMNKIENGIEATAIVADGAEADLATHEIETSHKGGIVYAYKNIGGAL